MLGILSHAALLLLNARVGVFSCNCFRCCGYPGWRCQVAQALTQLLCSSEIGTLNLARVCILISFSRPSATIDLAGCQWQH